MNRKEGEIFLCDCSGLIKAILWGYPEKGTYKGKGAPDINANTMIKQCEMVTSGFTKIKPGWLVWMEGHIGIYIGDGVVIESTAKWEARVLRSYCVGCGIANTGKIHERKWTTCGKFSKYVND